MSRFATVALFVGVLLLAPWAGRRADAATISVTPSTSSVSVGDTFSVTIDVNDVVDLYDVLFSFTFDPGIVRVTGITEEPFLGDVGATGLFPGSTDNNDGLVGGIRNKLEGTVGATGSGSLVKIQLVAEATGTSALRLANVVLWDHRGDFIEDFSWANGSVDVLDSPAVVPEPASLTLLGFGLAGLGARRWRQRKRA